MDEDASIRAHMEKLDDDELRKIVLVEAASWRAEALVIAREELARRGIDDLGDDETRALVSREAARIPVRWLRYYTWTLGAGSILELLAARSLITLAVGVVLASPNVIVAYGLRARRHWAYSLNHVLLFFDALLFALGGGDPWQHLARFAAMLLLWTWPNVVYFRRRRHLFT
jgi:hypothetical protein